MTLVRPQLCNYECEFYFEENDELGNFIPLEMSKQCSRHSDMSKDDAFLSIIDETYAHNDLIDGGVPSEACFVTPEGELQYHGELKWDEGTLQWLPPSD